MKKKLRGFVLIELAVVLIMISLIVTVFSASGSLIRSTSLGKARTLSTLSPVIGGVEDNVMWLDSVSKTSFDNAAPQDDFVIENWYDLNVIFRDKYHASQSSSSNRPLYIRDGINKLPAVNFDGSSHRMNVARSFDSTRPIAIFLVAQFDSTSGSMTALELYNGSQSKARIGLSGGNYIFSFGSQANLASVTANLRPHIFVLTGSGGTSSLDVDAYIDGVLVGNTSTASVFSNNQVLSIGSLQTSSDFFDGQIAEVIIFNRYLNSAEVGRVNTYLSRKWKIRLN